METKRNFKNSKLSDAYSIGCNKNDLLDSNCMDNHHRISTGFSHHSPQSITLTNKNISEIPDDNHNNNNNDSNHLQYTDLVVGHEKEPLLGKSDISNNSSSK
ncbi:unnamed protein product [Heterobilharzia americana]|nr:unnamed protein product [Heterobilharzia americana]